MNEILYESLDNPYVHSNIWNFTENQVRGSFLDRNNEEEYLNRINAELKVLEKISSQLRMATLDFLQLSNGADITAIQEKIKEILGVNGKDNKIYIEAINKTLTSNEFQSKLTASNKFNRNEDNSKYLSQIQNALNMTITDETTLNEVIDEAVKLLENNQLFSLNAESQKQQIATSLSKILNKDKDLFLEAIKDSFAHKLRKSTGRIREILKKQIKNNLPKDIIIQNVVDQKNKSESDITFIYNAFKEIFIKEVQNLNKEKERSEIENWCKNVIEGPFKATLQKSIGQSQLTGNYSEILMSGVFNNIAETQTGVEFSITNTGPMSEQEVRQTYFKNIVNNLQQNLTSIARTEKTGEKAGYTDLILNYKGKQARVQSKNSISIYLNAIEGEVLPFQAKLYKGISGGVANFLSMLNNNEQNENFTAINTNELNVLAYLIANALRFSTHGSVQKNGKLREKAVRTKTRKKEDGSGGQSQGLNYIFESINRLLELQIKNFLGVIITRVGEKISVIPEFSNLFFFLGNSVYLPTYIIIDNIIKQIKFETNEIASLKASIGNPSSLAYSDATAFYEEKKKSVGGKLDSTKNYTDKSLLAVGQQQGSSILSNTPLKSVNIIFDMNKLLDSSYNLY